MSIDFLGLVAMKKGDNMKSDENIQSDKMPESISVLDRILSNQFCLGISLAAATLFLVSSLFISIITLGKIPMNTGFVIFMIVLLTTGTLALIENEMI